MELITTHIGADFDALASVIAAKKLYPHAKAVLPGSPEKAVRDFLSLWRDELGLDNENEVDLDIVNRLVIVETKIASRIGRANQLLNKKGLDIHIYDHHLPSSNDIKASKDIYKKTGATVTILIDMIKKRKIPITPLEATVMALGIYEDTGSLTFQNTTKPDIEAVGWLFSQGVSLNTVSSYLKRELSQEELGFLSRLIENSRDYLINGIHVGIVALEVKDYVDDFASLIHKLMDIENFNVMFALAKSPSKIHMTARSSLPYVDVNRIAGCFGGGGHPYAASATIKGDRNLDDVVNRLISVLKQRIRPRVFADDIACTNSNRIDSSGTIRQARKILNEFRQDALAVFDRGKMAGIITRHDIERAIKKGFGHSRVKGYMKTKFTRINPKTPLYRIQQVLSLDKIGYVPVFKKKNFIGLLGSIDIAKVVHKDIVGKKVTAMNRKKAQPKARSVLLKMKKAMPKKIFNVLKLAGSLGDEMGFGVFCVGGFVRDILLNVKNFDVDLVIEGDALAFSKRMADVLNGSLVVHKRFGTATIVTLWDALVKRRASSGKEKFKIDIATARTEYYEYPAALPTVRFSSIKQDLYRRDFTINALAVSLNRNSFGRLIDFFNSQRDLRSRIIRVLHNLSFVEDPTRIFRAVRFEQRYSFKIEPNTENLIKTAVSLDMFGRTQKQRLRDEIMIILSEPRPIRALLRMSQLHELRFINPKLKVSKNLEQLFYAIDEAVSWYKLSFLAKRTIDSWIIYFMALMGEIPLMQVRRLCENFVFTKGDTRRILSAKKNTARISRQLSCKQAMPPSAVYSILEPLSYEVILFIMANAKTQEAKERISLFFSRYNGTKVSVSGRDLKALGIKPGPRYKKILDRVLYAKLDGFVKNRQDELKALKEAF